MVTVPTLAVPLGVSIRLDFSTKCEVIRMSKPRNLSNFNKENLNGWNKAFNSSTSSRLQKVQPFPNRFFYFVFLRNTDVDETPISPFVQIKWILITNKIMYFNRVVHDYHVFKPPGRPGSSKVADRFISALQQLPSSPLFDEIFKHTYHEKLVYGSIYNLRVGRQYIA